MASKLCDSCKSATATLYCRPDLAFLCLTCDSKIHTANKLASNHARVWICELCEQAPAHVTCKADAAMLCITCDRDIHSANPLARRHERFPVTPFYNGSVKDKVDDCCFSGVDGNGSREEEEEAASWLNTGQECLFSDQDPYLDLDYGGVESKVESLEQNSSGTDGVVPVETRSGRVSIGNENCYELDFTGGSKGFGYSCISHSSAMEKYLDLPTMVYCLAAVHVIALVYWIYRLVRSDRPPQTQRPKTQ